MARSKKTKKKKPDERDPWKRIIIGRIKQGKVLPFISKSVTNDLVFGNYQNLLEAWAERVEFPFSRIDYRLSRIAQFESVMHPASPHLRADVVQVKESFLRFEKDFLLDVVPIKELVNEIEDEFEELSFSEMSARLSYPSFGDDKKNPLLLLANLPLPIYLTTCYDSFLEVALKRAGKNPFTEICYWHPGLKSIPSVFEKEPDYQPSKETPLVYHLHGLDRYPESLVLTEDDHLDFLAAISRDENAIPLRVQQGLTDSSLLLLGYSLQSWEFRVLFSGVIKPRPNPLRRMNISIQLVPDEVEKKYFENYLAQAEFLVYWGELTRFMQELLSEWEGWA